MIPLLSPLDYVKAGAVAVALVLAAYIGWYFPHSALVAYKAQIQIATDKQIALNASKEKQHNLITQGIKDEYQARLSLLNRTYDVGVRQSSTTTLFSGQGGASGITPKPSYDLLTQQCAITTLMLVELQAYEQKRLGLDDDAK